MKTLNKSILIALLLGIVVGSCGDDDDDGIQVVPPRDDAEVYAEDNDSIREFLSTHFYNYEEFANPPAGFDFKIVFDTIAGANAGKIPLLNQVSTKTINRFDVNFNVYVLDARQGLGASPKFADSALVTYDGILLDNRSFDSAVVPVWFDLANTIIGFKEGAVEFSGADTIVENPDGTITYTNFGVGAIFMPSGLAYFNSPPSSEIPIYSPLIFKIQMIDAEVADHDGDGILSIFEDLDGDEVVTEQEDDTDQDGFPNFIDFDDDNDGIPTADENADPNGDGNPIDAVDSDGDGVPDYLDDDTDGSN